MGHGWRPILLSRRQLNSAETREVVMLRQVSLHGPELLPIITTLGIAFVTIVGVKTFLGVTFGGMFITLAGFLLPHSRAQSSANIEAGPLKVRWGGHYNGIVSCWGVNAHVCAFCIRAFAPSSLAS